MVGDKLLGHIYSSIRNVNRLYIGIYIGKVWLKEVEEAVGVGWVRGEGVGVKWIGVVYVRGWGLD